MYTYFTHNLSIVSELELPQLQPTVSLAQNVSIQMGTIDWSPGMVDEFGSAKQLAHNQAYFFWQGVGKFSVQAGTKIIIDPVPDVNEELIRLPLLGIVLATLLHQRGYLVLHASAVAIEHQGVIFLGDKGYGKSTLAATLCTQGNSLISDDIVTVKTTAPTQPVIYAAWPHIKLWPDTALFLGKNPDDLPRLSHLVEKRDWRVAERFCEGQVPVKALYILNQAAHLELQRLEAGESFIELIRNHYMVRFGDQLAQSSQQFHFFQCAELVKHVPVYRLSRPKSLGMLPATIQLIEANNALLQVERS